MGGACSGAFRPRSKIKPALDGTKRLPKLLQTHTLTYREMVVLSRIEAFFLFLIRSGLSDDAPFLKPCLTLTGMLNQSHTPCKC